MQKRRKLTADELSAVLRGEELANIGGFFTATSTEIARLSPDRLASPTPVACPPTTTLVSSPVETT